LAIPCLTLRENTEWVETIKAGWNILVGADEEKITEALLNFNPPFNTLEPARKLFGRGKAAKKIAAILDKFLKEL
jgi:UDP-N-acetylglucosamine 2-epimerase